LQKRHKCAAMMQLQRNNSITI